MPSSDDPDFLTVDGDLAHAQTAQRVAEQTLDRFGRIDTLVNMAGIFIGKPFTDYTVEDYAAITAVNLTGFFYITQRVITQMVDQGRGHVVNLSTNSYLLAGLIPNSRVTIYPDSAHGFLFQHCDQFAADVGDFLDETDRS